MESTNKQDLCYLCGKPLLMGDEINQDHIPPKQFFPTRYRKSKNPNLFSLSTHQSCNFDYKKDEDYFFHSLGPLAFGTNVGNNVMWDLKKRFKRHQGFRIGKMVSKEFEKFPSGIILPENKIV